MREVESLLSPYGRGAKIVCDDSSFREGLGRVTRGGERTVGVDNWIRIAEVVGVPYVINHMSNAIPTRTTSNFFRRSVVVRQDLTNKGWILSCEYIKKGGLSSLCQDQSFYILLRFSTY